MTQLTYPSGLTVRFDRNRTLTQTFNQRYEPLAVQSGPLWLTYTPTPAGDLGAVVDQSEDVSGCVRSVTRELKYDHQDRLAGWSDATAGGVGVCPLETLGSQVGAFTYVSGTDRVASQRVPDLAGPQAYAYGYDGAGSLSAIGRYDASGTTQVAAVCLRHDLLGRLVLAGPTGTVVSAGGTACTSDAEVTSAQGRFKYDARNRRVARQAGGQWTYVVSDGTGSPLSELALTGGAWTKVRDYVWLEGRLVGQVEYAGAQAWEYAVHVDHLGTPRALSNRSGQVVWSTYQRPYGEVLERTVVDPLSGRTVGTNVRLPGQYDERLLASVGLQGPYYNWNRWYLPGVGRYIEVDPLALAAGINGRYGPDWYGYVEGDPIGKDDPAGLKGGDHPGEANCVAMGNNPLVCKWSHDPPAPDLCKPRPKPELPFYECMKRCLGWSNPWPTRYVGLLPGRSGAVARAWNIGTSAGCAAQCAPDRNYMPKASY